MSGDWVEVTIEDIAVPGGVVGGPFGSELVRSDYRETGVPVIRGTNLGTGDKRFDARDFVFVSEEKADELRKNLAVPGDVVVTQRGTLGQVGIVPDDLGYSRFVISQSQMRLRCDSAQVDPRFVFYWLLRRETINFIEGNAVAAGVPHINLGFFKSLRLRIPSLKQQCAIAEVLGVLDDKIDLNRRMNQTLEAMAQALFRSWFVDFDPVRAKAEGRQPEGMDAETARLFPSRLVDAEEQRLPEGWRRQPLYACAKWVNGAAYRDFQFSAPGQGLPIIKIAELKSGVTSQTRFTMSNPGDKYLVDSGDVLFSWSGNPDTSIDTFVWGRGKGWLNQHIFKVITTGPEHRSFVLCLLRHLRPVFSEIARNKQTTGLGHVTAGDMKRLLVPAPPVAVVSAFHRYAGPLLNLVEVRAQESFRLAELRDVLLPKLLSGEVRVQDADARLAASA